MSTGILQRRVPTRRSMALPRLMQNRKKPDHSLDQRGRPESLGKRNHVRGLQGHGVETVQQAQQVREAEEVEEAAP